MSDPNQSDADRLKALEDRLARAAGKEPEKPHQEDHYSQGQIAWRMVIELVAGLAIGFGIGYGLDRLFGTMPIFLVLFVLFGLAAGINVMLRTAREIGNGGQAPKGQGDDNG
ncbi:AtpZ/AtpI family protein [Pseudoroseicyclus sp. CXY001]|uniref:AtpZ/AtpI family protein n=1 Tax=Pseudoroseicyclus sp. CXY001 TaxID=3242492 RepID=UPI0035715958